MRNYIYHHTCFEKELLRKQMLLLNENSIDFKVIDRGITTRHRAPLSGYFSAEIHVIYKDFDTANKLLRSLIEG